MEKKNDIFGVAAIALLVTLFLLLIAGQATANEMYNQIAIVVSFALVVAVLSLGAERGTELLKVILRFIFGYVPFLKAWQPSGAGSMVLAFLVSFAGVNNFDVNILNQFPQFANIDPQLVSYATVALLWICSSLWHRALPPGTGKAQPVK